MGRMRTSTRVLAAATLAALIATACGSSGEPAPTPSASLPSGPLGVVTPEAARAAVEGLCRVRATYADDPKGATATFENDAHEELHVIAAATQVVDRVAAGALLQAKEKVESGIAGKALPASFGADVDALIAATARAMYAIGLEAPACET